MVQATEIKLSCQFFFHRLLLFCNAYLCEVNFDNVLQHSRKSVDDLLIETQAILAHPNE